MSKAVFLDRDGTLMREVGYCSDPAHVNVFEDAAAAVHKLRNAGFRIIVVTNQSGIGRGFYTEEQYQAVHIEFLRQLQEPVDATYYAPEHPDVTPSRRKPSPAMLLEAAQDHGIDLKQSFMLGDREGDIEAGHNAGCTSILMLTGVTESAEKTKADFIATSLNEAADWILAAQPAAS